MGGVYLGEGKSGGSILKRRKKWGEYTKVKKKMGGVHICGRRPWRYEHPPSGCFWHLPLDFIYVLPITKIKVQTLIYIN